MSTWRIMAGDCRDSLASLEPGSVQTCVTSPPYFGLRDYGHDGQIGLEPTPDEFVTALVEVFRSVRRVLRDDGTVWLNLGDSYASNGPRGDTRSGFNERYFGSGVPGKQGETARHLPPNVVPTDRKPKDLLGIPWMVAFALRADGWYLRSDIIWAKPNPMPESVTDRPTKAHEYLFLLSKGPRYFYDANAIREPHIVGGVREREPGTWETDEAGRVSSPDGRNLFGHPEGRNKRSVWTVATHPYPGAHFATFPPKLIEPCILAGTSPKACGQCGAPWNRIVERVRPDPAEIRPKDPRTHLGHSSKSTINQSNWHDDRNPSREVHTVVWGPSCDHQDDTGSSVVLDPFSGAGTTGLVALRHNRSYVGCELNPEYVELSRNRIVDDAPLLNSGIELPEGATFVHRG